MGQRAFYASDEGTTAITAGTSSVAVQIENRSIDYSPHVRVVNSSSEIVFIAFGGPSVTANTTSSIPILSGEVDIFSLTGPYVAVIASAAASGPIYFTPGEGMD